MVSSMGLPATPIGRKRGSPDCLELDMQTRDSRDQPFSLSDKETPYLAYRTVSFLLEKLAACRDGFRVVRHPSFH